VQGAALLRYSGGSRNAKTAPELLQVLQGQDGAGTSIESLGQRSVAHMQGRNTTSLACFVGVQTAGQPARRFCPGPGVWCVPDGQGLEMRTVRGAVADPLHDRQTPGLQKLRETAQGGVETEVVVDLTHSVLWYRQRGTILPVFGVAIRNNGVQSVV